MGPVRQDVNQPNLPRCPRAAPPHGEALSPRLRGMLRHARLPPCARSTSAAPPPERGERGPAAAAGDYAAELLLSKQPCEVASPCVQRFEGAVLPGEAMERAPHASKLLLALLHSSHPPDEGCDQNTCVKDGGGASAASWVKGGGVQL